MDQVYGQIAGRAPNASVAVAGYPYLFNGRDCSFATFFSSAEMSRLNAGTAELDTLISARSRAAGFTYVEVRDDFAGHAVCDSAPWINNLSVPVDESFHPNRAGNRGYAVAISPALTGAAVSTADAGPSSGTTAGRPTGATLRAQADAVIAMDLTSSENLRQADLAGVDRGRVARAEAKLHSRNEGVVRAGLAELEALDAELAARG